MVSFGRASEYPQDACLVLKTIEKDLLRLRPLLLRELVVVVDRVESRRELLLVQVPPLSPRLVDDMAELVRRPLVAPEEVALGGRRNSALFGGDVGFEDEWVDGGIGAGG